MSLTSRWIGGLAVALAMASVQAQQPRQVDDAMLLNPPDGEWIIYDVAAWMTDGVPNDQLERIAADGTSEPEVLLEGTPTQGAAKPSYSPDGRRIVFGCIGPGGDGAACLLDADGSDLEILVDEPGVDENHFSWGASAT